MARIPLTGGAYQSRSLIAAAQSCQNLYLEHMPPEEGEPSPVVHLPTPGLRRLAQSAGAWRCLYRSKSGALYGAVGNGLYAISDGWVLKQLATLTGYDGPVSMSDNGTDLLVVDGSTSGWWVDLATNVMTPVQDAAFYGADRVRCIDQYFALNRPGTNQFYLTDAISRVFNPLYVSAKAGLDRLISLDVVQRQLWLIGDQTTEIYGITGAADFPLGIVGGGIDHGCAARHSVARSDGAMFWLSLDKDGCAVVLRGANYQAARVSHHGLEYILQGYARIDDAVGYVRQEGGHSFYVLIFPSANATWVFDMATREWHSWHSDNGRHRSACHTFAHGQHVVGDYATGTLYALDPLALDDNGVPIRRVRAFPHILSDGKRVSYVSLTLDMQTGTAKPGDPEPMVAVRWSDDRGATWGVPVLVGMGLAGDTFALPTMWNLGHARDRVFEFSWDFPAPTSLQGAWIETRVART